MDSRKTKVFLAAVFIVGAIIVVVYLMNKFNVVQKVEKFVDDEEGYEEEDNEAENETEEKESFDDEPKVSTPPKTEDVTKTKDVKVMQKQEDGADAETTPVKPINDLSTKFRNLIDEMDKQLKNKAVSDEIKKKVMTELMGSVETFSKIGDDTSNLISTIIQKYVPKKDNYTNEPVSKSMDTIKRYLKEALIEIENMESKNSTVMNERFVPSRDVPVTKKASPDTKEIIEGFENTPHYALY